MTQDKEAALKKWNCLAAAAACLLALFGCAKPVDGPGMVNDRPWQEFTLSRSDSYAQYNFWFTVRDTDTGWLLTGECRDESGNEYALETGVRLSEADGAYLRSLWLGEQPDVQPDGDEDLILLDAPDIRLVLTWRDGTQQEKFLREETSIALYKRFLPYFTK